MESRKLLSGAGSYFQGENILHKCGGEIAGKGFHKLCVIGGKRALTAAGDALYSGFAEESLDFDTHIFSGFCTAAEIDFYSRLAKDGDCDCIVGVGGGKALDLSKAVAATSKLPVFTIPTVAATCAAFASLSILYDEKGHQVDSRMHPDEVSGVFVDTGIIAKSPARYLAAGMADAMAKSCEFGSMRSALSCDDVDVSRYLGYKMAKSCDEVLLTYGKKAYAENCDGKVGDALENAVYVAIAATGIESGMGRFAGEAESMFAIAHGFNEIMRGKYVGVRQWLHGEIVAVGILAQLYANGEKAAYIRRVKDFFAAIHVPVSLRQLGVVFDDEGFSKFRDEISLHSGVTSDCRQRVDDAVTFVRD